MYFMLFSPAIIPGSPFRKIFQRPAVAFTSDFWAVSAYPVWSAKSGLILFVADLLKPFDCSAIERLLNCDVRHGMAYGLADNRSRNM
jgi:hypothetical protein